jgi:hypothetical protein
MRVTCRPGPFPHAGQRPEPPSGLPAPRRADDLPRQNDPPRQNDGETLLFSVVLFDGDHRRARDVLLAFESARAADDYATKRGFDDYLVVPLAFLASSTGV